MSIYEFGGKTPKIGAGTWVHETSQIIGDVEIGEGCFIAAGAVLRGDFGSIRVGDRSSVQESCTLHCRPGDKCVVGNDVTVGHGAVLHACAVEDDAMIAMNATVLTGARVGRGAIVAAGAVVGEGVEIPAGAVAAGVPAKVRRETTDADRARLEHAWKAYAALRDLHKYKWGT